MSVEPRKLVATAIGVGLCVAALVAWRLPASGSPPGLDLRLIVTPPGELTVAPAGVVASARAMQAGDAPARGSVEVRNITGRSLRVRPVALPSLRAMARRVRLRALAGGEAIASGTLGALEHPGGPGLLLAPRESRRIELASWMEPGATGYRGRILDVTLEFRASPVGVRG